MAAAKAAGLETVPVTTRAVESQPERVALQLTENFHRADLSPIDEAEGIAELMDLLEVDQDEVAAYLGVSKSTVSGALRLLTSDRAVTDALAAGRITKSTAIDLARMPSHRQADMLAQVIGKTTGEAQRILREARREGTGEGGLPGSVDPGAEDAPPAPPAPEPPEPAPSPPEAPPEPAPEVPEDVELRTVDEVSEALFRAKAAGSLLTVRVLEWVLGLRPSL